MIDSRDQNFKRSRCLNITIEYPLISVRLYSIINYIQVHTHKHDTHHEIQHQRSPKTLPRKEKIRRKQNSLQSL